MYIFGIDIFMNVCFRGLLNYREHFQICIQFLADILDSATSHCRHWIFLFSSKRPMHYCDDECFHRTDDNIDIDLTVIYKKNVIFNVNVTTLLRYNYQLCLLNIIKIARVVVVKGQKKTILIVAEFFYFFPFLLLQPNRLPCKRILILNTKAKARHLVRPQYVQWEHHCI